MSWRDFGRRRRRELSIDRLRRPLPVVTELINKQNFAAYMIKEEHESFGSQDTDMHDDEFEGWTRDDQCRKLAAGDILRGMLIRGRLQAAVFDVFMQLCLQGVCSLSALEHPIHWNSSSPDGTCQDWIERRLRTFECFQVDWGFVQRDWSMKNNTRWIDYIAPEVWLAIMIGRSFTSLDAVFDIIHLTNQLGPVNAESLKRLVDNHQLDSTWKADINIYRTDQWYGNGTFAFWLPEDVDPSILEQGFDTAATTLSQEFYKRLERTERHYAVFFDISRNVFDADVQQGARDVRDWVKQDIRASFRQHPEVLWDSLHGRNSHIEGSRLGDLAYLSVESGQHGRYHGAIA